MHLQRPKVTGSQILSSNCLNRSAFGDWGCRFDLKAPAANSLGLHLLNTAAPLEDLHSNSLLKGGTSFRIPCAKDLSWSEPLTVWDSEQQLADWSIEPLVYILSIHAPILVSRMLTRYEYTAGWQHSMSQIVRLNWHPHCQMCIRSAMALVRLLNSHYAKFTFTCTFQVMHLAPLLNTSITSYRMNIAF